jgi:hypothetical protein
MRLKRLRKLASDEKEHLKPGHLGPGVSERKITPLPVVKKPEEWEFSAHPHHAERAGSHIDIRLGNPETEIAHSFVLPRRTELPGPGEMARVIPTFDHSIPYMDFTGKITTPYGRGEVEKGRRTVAEVYHADPGDEAGTKLRFNLYEGKNPEEFSIRKDSRGSWFLHNKTQTRLSRPDIPSFKPSYKEIPVDKIDPTNEDQAMMPKLDGAHVILDLKAGRSPRVFSYRVGKISPTKLIEHTHKMPELLEKKVPKELGNTMLRGEAMGITDEGKAVPTERLSGLLNAKVWESRKKQEDEGITIKPFPFDVITYKGKLLENAPFSEKVKVLKEVGNALSGLDLPEIATTVEDKISLLNRIRAKQHPLTNEGYVLIDKDRASTPIKAKFTPDYDVYVRRINPAISGETGKPHNRAGSISYSWTPDGPIMGTVGGFKHEEGRDMLDNPDKYLGRVAKVVARKVFKDSNGDPKSMFQPRFKEWHLDKGDIEKAAMEKIAPYKSLAQQRAVWAKKRLQMLEAEKAQEALKIKLAIQKEAAFIPRLRRFGETLASHNVEEALSRYQNRIMNNPYVRQVAKKHPNDMSTFESYITKGLGAKPGDIPGAADLPSLSKGRRQIVRLLNSGQKEVGKARKATRNARLLLAGGVAAPIAGGAALKEVTAAEAPKERTSTMEKLVPAAAAGAVGTSPLVQGLRSGALGKFKPSGSGFKNVEELQKALKPGDIILTSHPGKGSKFKAPIAALGGDPYGYHVESITHTPTRGNANFGFIHSSPAQGGAFQYNVSGLDPHEDVIIKRFKDTKNVKPYLKNLENFRRKEQVLEDVLGGLARSRMYDNESAVKGGLKSFLPKPLHRLLKSTPAPGATVCSTLPGQASPVCLAPGVPEHEVMPHHIRRSAALETVGHYRAPRTVGEKAYEHLLQASPWVLRGLLGAGLGYGAYRGAKAIMNRLNKD